MKHYISPVFLLIFNSFLCDFKYENYVPALFLNCQIKFIVHSVTNTYQIRECRREGGKSLTCNILQSWCSINIQQPPLKDLAHFH